MRYLCARYKSALLCAQLPQQQIRRILQSLVTATVRLCARSKGPTVFVQLAGHSLQVDKDVARHLRHAVGTVVLAILYARDAPRDVVCVTRRTLERN